MTDYEPLDLSAFCNVGTEVLDQPAAIAPGTRMFQGLPFFIGSAQGEKPLCLLAFGEGLRHATLTIPIGKTARNIIIAHCLLETDLGKGGLPGKLIAHYVIHYADGSQTIPIRERFEISLVTDKVFQMPVLPFGAVYDSKHQLYPRYEGRWDDAGRRQEESMRATSQAFYLWVWTNPHPDKAVTSVEVIPEGPKFIVAALTLGHLDEHPFIRAGRRELKIILPQPEDAEKPFDLTVDVDRGVATYPYALPSASAETFLADDFKGWGERQNPWSSPAYVEVAATPSATVSVRQDGDVLGSFRWSELETCGTLTPTPRLQVELVDRGRNWVHTTVLDDETGLPMPCRIHFRSPEGIPYQPYGHHGHVNSNLDSWNVDVGGDVRLGQITYGYIDGTCQGWLPRGEVLVDAACGFEYEPLRTRVSIAPGQRDLCLRLKRWRNMNAERWFSGDTHVHFLSTQGGHCEAKGEDLNVINLHQSQWGHLFTGTEEFSGRPSISADGRTIVYVGQENRHHLLGHIHLLGLKRPVMPWCSGGPGEAELGGTLEVTLSHWADQCHHQDGTVIAAHFPVPNGELSALIATGRVDAVEMHRHSLFRHLDYYRYLNCGYRLPLVGGTDKMSSDVPVGLYRTYVYIPPEEDFTYETWCGNLARGRTFQSSGPLLQFSVEGKAIGDTVVLPGNGGTVEVEAGAESIFPIHTLEIVKQGQVVASVKEAKGARALRLKAKVKIDGHSWLAARVGGPDYMQPLSPIADRAIFAHTSPIYLACGGEWDLFNQETAHYMLTLIEGSLTYIREIALSYPPGSVTHHHGEDNHRAYLERPFLQAREAISKRFRQTK